MFPKSHSRSSEHNVTTLLKINPYGHRYCVRTAFIRKVKVFVEISSGEAQVIIAPNYFSSRSRSMPDMHSCNRSLTVNVPSKVGMQVINGVIIQACRGGNRYLKPIAAGILPYSCAITTTTYRLDPIFEFNLHTDTVGPIIKSVSHLSSPFFLLDLTRAFFSMQSFSPAIRTPPFLL